MKFLSALLTLLLWVVAAADPALGKDGDRRDSDRSDRGRSSDSSGSGSSNRDSSNSSNSSSGQTKNDSDDDDDRDDDSHGRGGQDRREKSDKESSTNRAKTSGSEITSSSSSSASSNSGRLQNDSVYSAKISRSESEQDRARSEVRKGNIKKLSEVMAIVNREVPGSVVSVKLGQDANGPVYELKILSAGDKLRKIKVDGKSGSVY